MGDRQRKKSYYLSGKNLVSFIPKFEAALRTAGIELQERLGLTVEYQ